MCKLAIPTKGRLSAMACHLRVMARTSGLGSCPTAWCSSAVPLRRGGHRESSESRVVDTNDLIQGLTDDQRDDGRAFAAREEPGCGFSARDDWLRRRAL